MTVPASMLRLWAASVKLAEVMRARWSSMTMHLAWRQERVLPSVARDRGSKVSGSRLPGHRPCWKVSREFPQENGVGGVVPLFPMDVDEEPHPQIRLSIHPAGQGPEQLLGLATGVERVAGDQDALPCLAKQLLHDHCGVSARRTQRSRWTSTTRSSRPSNSAGSPARDLARA